MISRVRILAVLGIALFTLTTLAVLGIGSSRPIEAQSVPIYQRLQEAAVQGDEWARDYLARVNAFLGHQGLPIPPQERQVGSADEASGIRVWVRGHEPFYLKIYNRQEFADLGELQAYVENRRAALTHLANEDLDRQVEVSISLEEYTDVSQVWQLKTAYGLDIDQMTVHLFLNGERHSVMLVGDPKDPGEQPIIDFTESAEAVKTQLRQLASPVSVSEGDPNPYEFEFKVAWMRGKIRAADALELDSERLVMLVDPVSDLSDAYNGRAVDVEIVDVPHLLAIKSRLEVVTGSPPGSDSVQPTPAPIQEVK